MSAKDIAFKCKSYSPEHKERISPATFNVQLPNLQL